MKFFVTKLCVLTSLMAMVLPAYADSYYCSYTTRISFADKHNSKGKLLANSYSNAAVAAILRQDRANFYVFNKSDSEDESDCRFDSKAERAKMQKSLSRGSIPQYAKRVIVDNNPLLGVDVYANHVDVEILDTGNSASRSRVR